MQKETAVETIYHNLDGWHAVLNGKEILAVFRFYEDAETFSKAIKGSTIQNLEHINQTKTAKKG
jgi:hypothetical protein